MKRRHVLFFLAIAACADKVHSDAVDALGPEDPNIPEGPRHRAGQSCTTCHGERGPAEPVISVGGTVYVERTSNVAAREAVVTIIDVNDAGRDFTTNDVGNFYVEKAAWNPTYPLRARVRWTDEDGRVWKQEMETLIRRDGGCGSCHRNHEGSDPSHVSRIHVKKPASDDGGGT